MTAPGVYLASDTHFGAGSPESDRRRREAFLAWLKTLPDGAILYLLGDIFDFWLDYPTYMPKTHLEVLYRLRRLQERRVEIKFVGGNHDIWCARYLHDSLGIQTLPCGVVVEHQGLRLRLDHGDGLLGGDAFYSLFRAAVRNPALVFLAKSIHPEILHGMAAAISRLSRANHKTDPDKLARLIRHYGETHDHGDVDHLVVGHIHYPVQVDFGGWTFTCLGDWVVHRTYGRLRDGRLEVVRFEAVEPTGAPLDR
jgi:UDP-2,3-diacylglucosamine hydrolase